MAVEEMKGQKISVTMMEEAMEIIITMIEEVVEIIIEIGITTTTTMRVTVNQVTCYDMEKHFMEDA